MEFDKKNKPIYHEDDKEGLRIFLNHMMRDEDFVIKPIGESFGLTNAEMDNWNVDETWVNKIEGLTWSDDYPKRLVEIDWSSHDIFNDFGNNLVPEISFNFDALIKLNCSDNSLYLIDVSACRSLVTLSCSNNRLLDIDVSQNLELEFLDCSCNDLRHSLNIRNNTKLKFLFAFKAGIPFLDISSNAELNTLKCSLTHIFFRPFDIDDPTEPIGNLCSMFENLQKKLEIQKTQIVTIGSQIRIDKGFAQRQLIYKIFIDDNCTPAHAEDYSVYTTVERFYELTVSKSYIRFNKIGNYSILMLGVKKVDDEYKYTEDYSYEFAELVTKFTVVETLDIQEKVIPYKYRNLREVSFLLGAGFSKPMGYPIGDCLSEKILNQIQNFENITFDSIGNPKYNTNESSLGFGLLKSIINYFIEQNKKFNYEEFYDYLIESAKDVDHLWMCYKKHEWYQLSIGELDKKEQNKRYIQELFHIKVLFNQLVKSMLNDKDEKVWYSSNFLCKSKLPEYNGFLQYLSNLQKKYDINIHTLNHDLFFESLNNSEWITGKICDGFEELGSSFYGEFTNKEETHKCRLSQYTGKYDKPIRLYKLHGSLDYYVYKSKHGGIREPKEYIKTRNEISEFYKEFENEYGVLEYDNFPMHFYPDFLTGTSSKIERYEDPIFYKKIFDLFKQNLNKADALVIIGYGFKDKEINRYIFEEFGKEKPCFVINPDTDINYWDFRLKMGKNTKLHKSYLEDFDFASLGIDI